MNNDRGARESGRRRIMSITHPRTTFIKAARFRAQAETIAEKIADLRSPRQENTPKRARQGMQARLDAANLVKHVASDGFPPG